MDGWPSRDNPASFTTERSLDHLLILIATGLGAGAINAIGGGGSFIALPVVMALGVPALQANASLTVALLPGGWATAWAYREDLQRFDIAPLRSMLTVSALGGLLGAILLLLTPTDAFDAVLPWLVLIATLTFALGREVGVMLGRVVRVRANTLLAIQFLLAVYAGYFGGGVGIMMMSAWSLLATDDVLAMQAARMVMVTTANAVAAAWFAISGAVAWPQTLVILAAGVVGGYAGVRAARRLRPAHVRKVIVAIGLAISIGLFARSCELVRSAANAHYIPQNGSSSHGSTLGLQTSSSCASTRTLLPARTTRILSPFLGLLPGGRQGSVEFPQFR